MRGVWECEEVRVVKGLQKRQLSVWSERTGVGKEGRRTSLALIRFRGS